MEQENHLDNSTLAAIDLGSNSFHMVIGRQRNNQIQLMDKLHEKVQLASGLDHERMLDAQSQERALSCLKSFAQRLQGLPKGAVRTVGTSTFREARNIYQFLRQAESILGHPIEIISGREEARLIYLGIAHTNADDQLRRLVLDVGGGSTECIIGSRFEPLVLESLPLGCLRHKKFFHDGKITKSHMENAINAAMLELEPYKNHFIKTGWEEALGSSGTIKSVQNACIANGLSQDSITKPALEELIELTLACQNINDVDLPGVKSDRKTIFAPGLAIVVALFKQFELTQLNYVEGALREGVLYDMVGRLFHEDVRDRSIRTFQKNYGVDTHQAELVEQSLMALCNLAKQSSYANPFLSEHSIDLLKRACAVHEAGLSISHSQFHKHSGYLVQHSDFPGFFKQEQAALACIVRNHRRKIKIQQLEKNSQFSEEQLLVLTIFLRIAVSLNRSRHDSSMILKSLNITAKTWHFEFQPGWLEANPLVKLALEQEKTFLKQAGIELIFL